MQEELEALVEQQSVVENKMVALQRMGSVPQRPPLPHQGGKGAFIPPHGPLQGCLTAAWLPK